ncbi:flagellar hook-length control protein FliK [Alteromonas ponticola]|uniref:Flagellar hook-length control protein FliK n=1 Tax=Alteromonas aquimaris TaxID=2998417 RepID=A0ABT3P2G2_9ALTE|nr:flagellar hook-length control protein FliK [Alteromonas aquimaris]MCW8106955.1 flagellar hook-length control protein FliK [Alteromonas aquimaris]
MNFKFPLDSSGLTKTPDSGAANTLTNHAARVQGKVTLARLPENVLRIQPQSAANSDDLHFKTPSSFSFNDKAQHQLARNSNFLDTKPVLAEYTTSTKRVVVSPEQASKIAQAVSKALPANASVTAGPIQATVVHAPGSQLSLKLALPGSPIVNIALNQPVVVTQGDKIQLSLIANSATDLRININTGPPNNTFIAEMKLTPNHILAQQFTKLQLTTGVSISPHVLQTILDSAGLSSVKLGDAAAVSLSLKNQQLAVTTQHTQAIAQLTLTKEVVRSLPVLTSLDVVKSLPQLVPLEQTAVKSSLSNSPSTGHLSARLESAGKMQLHDTIMQLSRRLLNETGSTREALTQLITTLNSSPKTTSSDTVALMRGLSHQLTQGLVAEESIGLKNIQGVASSESTVKPPMVQALLTLFSSPALPVTSQSIISPITQSNFVNGLVAVLQMTFAGRAIRNQPHLATLADDPRSFLHKSMTNLGATGSPSKSSQEFSRFDGHRQILDSIKTLLANHRQQKLTNLDNRIQGQESFYYVLPVNSQSQAPPEVLLKREEQQPDAQNTNDNTDKVWNFTMKLDIDELGKLLVKSKVSPTSLNLNLYASSDALLEKVQDTLPALLKRFSALGLTIEQSSCQRGKIPDTLSDNPYQLFETRA